MGHGSPSNADGHFGYDGFALTETQSNHVVEKCVFCQLFCERMEFEKKCLHCFIITTKNRLVPGCGEHGALPGARLSPYRFCSHTVP